jgi:hypothetical protein
LDPDIQLKPPTSVSQFTESSQLLEIFLRQFIIMTVVVIEEKILLQLYESTRNFTG